MVEHNSALEQTQYKTIDQPLIELGGENPVSRESG